MTFLEQRFFDDIAPRATSAPEYRTTIKTLRGGAEHRNALWADPLRTFDVALTPRDLPSIKAALDFAATTRGAANGFRLRDWSDCRAEHEYLGTGDGSTYWFRFGRVYGNYWRRILKPVAGTVSVRLNGATLHPSLYTVDTANGLLILKNTPVPGVLITASFDFDVPVRFAEDGLSIAMNYHRLGHADGITLREIRLREVIDTDAIDAARALL